MKVLIYSEGLRLISKSGVGRAIKHQMKALDANGIKYTLNPHDDYDIVHINTVGLKSYLLARKAKKKGKKVILHAHSTEEDFRNSFIGSNLISPLFKWWLIKVYRMGDQIITPTPYSKKILSNYNLRVPIEAVSNGIDIEYFKKNEQLGKAFRKAFHFSEDDKLILCVGLHIQRKGIVDFIELATRMPSYKFVWLGYTNPLLIPSKIRRLIKNPPDNAYFLGYIQGDLLLGAYSGSDLFLMPSYEETEGIVVLEALASKQPIIVRNIGVYNAWLKDKVHCYKANNVNEFEDLIQKKLNCELDDLVEKGYTVVEERTLEKIGKQLSFIYMNTLQKSSVQKKPLNETVIKESTIKEATI
jgi:1,2-diacylglycerol-3-alpha-glucose alpha-1,2-glucosyltransferase